MYTPLVVRVVVKFQRQRDRRDDGGERLK